ncbi:MAG: polyprenyl synthetase family protein [Mycobacterium sp.]
MPGTLGLTRELITPVLRELVNRLDPMLRSVVSYHFGWSDEHGVPANSNAGIAIRPSLVFLAVEAAGGRAERAIPGAAAVELVHNFSLVHDDVMGRDECRRHRPTLWAVWGDPVAVLAGDALLALAHEAILDSDSPHAGAAHTVLAVATRELIRGQSAGTAFERRDDVRLGERLEMAWGKTAALMSASAVIGAKFAGAPTPVCDALGVFGGSVGLASQLIDDLSGIWGQPEVTGKPVYSDLRSCKKSLPVTWAIECGGAAGRELASWMADRAQAARSTDDELHDIAGLVERAGGRAWAAQEAHRRAALAARALAGVRIEPGPACELHALANYLLGRQA